MRSATALRLLLIVCPLLPIPVPATADEPRADVVVADFEGDDYGAWKVTGTATEGGLPVSGVAVKIAHGTSTKSLGAKSSATTSSSGAGGATTSASSASAAMHISAGKLQPGGSPRR